MSNRVAALCVLGAIAITGILCWSYYANRLLDERQPIVETCIKHRVDQKVYVNQ
jgi:hypothetical protein